VEIDKLKYYIAQRLTSLTSINVYNEKVPDGATFPYLVFKFPASSHVVRHRKDWILEMDYWSNSYDDTDILQAAIYVKSGTDSVVGLDSSTQCEIEGFYYCNIDFEGEIPTDESNMSRYNQRFLIKVD